MMYWDKDVLSERESFSIGDGPSHSQPNSKTENCTEKEDGRERRPRLLENKGKLRGASADPSETFFFFDPTGQHILAMCVQVKAFQGSDSARV